MSWFKVDDHLHSHRKAMRAGVEAMGLWVLAGSWSGAEESDGWVPGYVLTRLAGPESERLAERLCAAGLWHADEREGEAGYEFHAWDEYQPTKADLERKRAEGRERMRKARAEREQERLAAEARADSVRAHKPSTAPAPTPNLSPEFETWWEGYPRKVGKAAAAKAYTKARKTATAQQLIDGQTNAVAVWQACRTEHKFIPHPSTWLNEGRWEDEQTTIPVDTTTARPTVTHMQCPGTDCPGTRHEWTDHRANYFCMGA